MPPAVLPSRRPPPPEPGPARPASAYREAAPPDAAREHLVCLWTHRTGDAAHAQPVLPDGCMDIVWIGGRPPAVAGPATRAMVASLAPGAAVVGARFRPGWAAGVLGVDASELRDLHLPLGDVAPSLARRLSAAVADAGCAAERLAAAARELTRLLADAPPADPLVRASVDWLARRPHGRVDELSRAMHVSPRHLQRRLRAGTGYSPKTLHRILRFQRLLLLANAADGRAPLSLLALRAGYADQAHMTREVRRLAGRVPSALLPGADSALRLAELF